MGAYRALFGISVGHGYFASGQCSCLEFILEEATARLMRNTGLLVKRTGSGIQVLHDQDNVQALRAYLEDANDEFVLCFKVYAEDPAFKTYSVPFTSTGQELLYFDNRSIFTTADGKLRLHSSKHITKKYLLAPDAAPLRDLLSPRDRLIPPIAVLRLGDLARYRLLEESTNGIPLVFTIDFETRQTYWKYYLQCPIADSTTFIHDPDDRVGFTPATPVELSDGRPVFSYRSTKLIPLRERYDFRFQLKQPKNGGEKILFRQLPYARVGQIGNEVVANRSRVVSEIYINC